MRLELLDSKKLLELAGAFKNNLNKINKIYKMHTNETCTNKLKIYIFRSQQIVHRKRKLK